MGAAIFIVWVVLAAAAASWVGWKVKGRPLTGFLLGVLLGWLGVLIIALVPPAPEMRVQRELQRRAIEDEASRRARGAEPWSGQDPPGPAS